MKGGQFNKGYSPTCSKQRNHSLQDILQQDWYLMKEDPRYLHWFRIRLESDGHKTVRDILLHGEASCKWRPTAHCLVRTNREECTSCYLWGDFRGVHLWKQHWTCTQKEVHAGPSGLDAMHGKECMRIALFKKPRAMIYMCSSAWPWHYYQ